MPRNPDNKRVEVLLSQEQHAVLLDYFDAEYPGADLAEGIRRTLAWAIPSFGKVDPLKTRGKYERKKNTIRCPRCLKEADPTDHEKEWLCECGLYSSTIKGMWEFYEMVDGQRVERDHDNIG